MEPLLRVEGLRTEFVTPRGVVKAVDGVDLEVREGEVLGLVGESGCGKSVTALSVMYLVPDPPGRIAGGQIWFKGINLLAGTERETSLRRDRRGRARVIRRDPLIRRHRARMNKIRGRDISMIFQEPMSSLNPVLPVGDQLAEVLRYQRRRETCDALLARRAELAPEDIELFEQAISAPDATERERLLADFCLRSGLPVDRVGEVVERGGISLEERVEGVRRLASRNRVSHRWFLNLVRDLDSLDREIAAREWRVLSGVAGPEDRGRFLRARAQYQSVRSLFRFLMAVPLLRRVLMKPIEDEARRQVLRLLRMVRIPEPLKIFHEYPHELSGGMVQRAMIAMALACDPALMIADEPTTALDVTTQAQILRLITDLRKRLNSAILYITHDLAVIAELADRVAVMYAGKIVEDAAVGDLFARPLHPYTQGLLESVLSMDKPVSAEATLPTIPGTVPDLINPPAGCRFHPRCKYAMERCKVEEPRLALVEGDRKVACFLYPEGGVSARLG